MGNYLAAQIGRLRQPAAGLNRQGIKACRSARGFTLLELMVAVVVIGVLSAMALSSYRSSVLKSNRSAAKAALMDLAAREEKFYSLNNTYSNVITDLYGQSTTLTWPVSAPLSGTASYHIIQPTVNQAAAAVGATPATPANFTLEADPIGNQLHDACGSYKLTSIGQQTVTGTASGCW